MGISAFEGRHRRSIICTFGWAGESSEEGGSWALGWGVPEKIIYLFLQVFGVCGGGFHDGVKLKRFFEGVVTGTDDRGLFFANRRLAATTT